MLLDLAVVYLSSSFVKNHLPSVFHMLSSVYSLLCIREARVSLSQSFVMFCYSKFWDCMLQKPLVRTARIISDCNQTWPQSGKSNGLENKVQLWPMLSCIFRRFLCPKICHWNPCIFIQLIRELFALYFTSCYNSGMYCRSLECRNKTVWMFNREQNFRGNSFTRNDYILNSVVVNDFPDSKVLTSFLWRPNRRKFSDGSRNDYMQAIAGPESASDAPLF